MRFSVNSGRDGSLAEIGVLARMAETLGYTLVTTRDKGRALRQIAEEIIAFEEAA